MKKILETTSIRQTFGQTLTQLAQTNKNIYVVDADLASSLSLLEFKQKFPTRFVESGVSESNAAGVAAGIAKTGKTVFLTSFSCFSPALNWGVIKQSICYNNSKVIIVGSHAGLASGDLGATHQMLEDVALTSALPNLQVVAPLDSRELTTVLPVLIADKHPTYLRLYRTSTPNYFSKKSFTLGKSHLLTTGSKITFLSYGAPLGQIFEILETTPVLKGLVEVLNISSLKPLDADTILKSVKKTGAVLVLEDHQKIGGLGQIVSSLLLQHKVYPKFIHLGVDNSFGQSGKDVPELYHHYGIGKVQILSALHQLLK